MKIEVIDLDVSLTENFIKFCCDELESYPDFITIEDKENLLKNGALGLCYEIDINTEYLIVVAKNGRNITEIYNTIAHEMIHIKQYMKQNLSQSAFKEYKPPYDKRWWEIEAKENSFNLVKKYVDNLYSMV